MHQYTTYPTYKLSYGNWIGEIPTSWSVKRFKFLLSSPLKYGANESAELNDTDLPRYIRITDVSEDGSLRDETFRSLPEEIAAPYLLEEGDILLARSGATIGKTFIYRKTWGRAAYAGYLIRARTLKSILDANFAYYFLQSSSYWHWLNSVFIQATIQNVSAEKYANLFLPLPGHVEQQAIVRFLDFKTAQIDTLIAKQKTLLDKLAEKRTALISHAVTKGLDPSVPIKASEVAWLGEIPAHWVLKRLRFCMNTNPSKGEIKLSADELVSFVPMEAVGEFGGLNLVVEKELCDIGAGYTYFADNDVVVAKITPCFENGKGAIACGLKNGIAFGTTELHVMRSGYALLPEYLFHLTMSHPFRCIGESEMYGAGGQKRVPETFLKDFRIGLPPVEEQQYIVTYINKVNQKLDLQMSKATDVVNRLVEYRSTLITNAVTGKIDVRGFDIPPCAARMAL